MFFEGDRIDAFREMICAETVEEREAALAKILPEQQGDFEKLYEALEGNPVTIRFLDPPLHEFVPTEEEDIKKLADAQGKTVVADQDYYRFPARVQPDDGTSWMPSCSYLPRDR